MDSAKVNNHRFYYNNKLYCNVMRIVSRANQLGKKPRPATLQYYGIAVDENGKSSTCLTALF